MSMHRLLTSMVDFFIMGGILLSYISNYTITSMPVHLSWCDMFVLWCLVVMGTVTPAAHGYYGL
jgi:hypothetical protein